MKNLKNVLLWVLTPLMVVQSLWPGVISGPIVWMVVATIAIAISGAFIESKSELLFPKFKFLVWALGTSLAEIVVCIIAGVNGTAHIGTATVLGSDSINLAFGGFVALLSFAWVGQNYLPKPTKLVTYDQRYAVYGMLCLFFGTAFTIVQVLTNHVAWYIFAILANIAAILWFWDWSKAQPDDEEEASKTEKHVIDYAVLMVAFALLIAASHVLVEQMSVAAINWGVSEFLVSQLAGAIGTSVPEFAVGLAALIPLLVSTKKGRHSQSLRDMVFGIMIMAAASNAVDMLTADTVQAISIMTGGPGVTWTPTVMVAAIQACLLTVFALLAVYRSKAASIGIIISSIMVVVYIGLTVLAISCEM